MQKRWGFFWESGYLTYIYCLKNGCFGRAMINFCSFWKSPLIMILLLNLKSSQLNIFSKNMTHSRTAKLKRSKLFFHAKLPWCHQQPLVSMSKGNARRTEIIPKIKKFRLQPKGLFRTMKYVVWQNYTPELFSELF